MDILTSTSGEDLVSPDKVSSKNIMDLVMMEELSEEEQ